MPKLRRFALLAPLVVGAICGPDCATPTALTITVYSEVVCGQGSAVALVGGVALRDLPQNAPSSVSTKCGADGRMGSLVIVPAGAKDESVAFAVMQRADGQPADACLEPATASGCIVAKRQLRFEAHDESEMRVDLRLSCLGVLCSPDQTCVKGSCLDAQTTCGASCDESTLGNADGGAPSDGATESNAPDARADADGAAGTGNDAATDAGADASVAFHDLTDPAKWAAFDVLSIAPAATGYEGAVFDGRYIYLVPGARGPVPENRIVARYDTQAAFATAASWSTFDLGTINVLARGFTGAAFDGRYIYFVPYENDVGGGNVDGVVTRYDTQANFAAAGSWATFDIHTVNAMAMGFEGATFDGRYVYMAPFFNTGYDGVVARYDTKSAFAAAASWTTFDVKTVNAGARGFNGAAFDGRHVYLAPSYTGVSSGQAVRYDTTVAFGAVASWETFQTMALPGQPAGFGGTLFDGRFIYYVPTYQTSVFARYDTHAAFTTAASWASFDVSAVNAKAAGFFGAGFDGRYAYFAPNNNNVPDGVVARYDTLAAFGAAASWRTFDTTKTNPQAKGFVGTAFDGRYMYFVPAAGSVIVRFDAKFPATVGVKGSFL